jgi:hypothetical protein
LFGGRLKSRCKPSASAAEPGSENKPVIAAVNRCATQNQTQHRVFQQSVKADPDTNRLELPGGRLLFLVFLSYSEGRLITGYLVCFH